MPNNSTSQKVQKIQKLQKEVADLKGDVRFLKGFLLKLDNAQQQGQDEVELQKIEHSIDGLASC